jgi:hypothetical protein
LIDLLKQKAALLPDSLEESLKKQAVIQLPRGKTIPSTMFYLGYIGRLLENIRIIDLPEGNKAIADFMKGFREKYGNEELGKSQLKKYEAILRNVEIDLKAGVYNKDSRPVRGLTN